MAKLVQKSGYIKSEKAGGYMKYIATREGVEKLTGNGVSLNTSLNRRGEPMICSPTDALNMFFGSDLQYLIMQDVLVVKTNEG